MKYFLILLTVTLATSLTNAQSAEDSVKTTINNMFAGMKNADVKLLKSAFADSVIFQTIAVDKSGKVIVQNESLVDFVDFIGKSTPGDADERITYDVIRVDGPLAIAWTPYSFYYKGKFSHCGVDSYQLVKINGEWRIQYIIDTRRRVNCQ